MDNHKKYKTLISKEIAPLNLRIAGKILWKKMMGLNKSERMHKTHKELINNNNNRIFHIWVLIIFSQNTIPVVVYYSKKAIP